MQDCSCAEGRQLPSGCQVYTVLTIGIRACWYRSAPHDTTFLCVTNCKHRDSDWQRAQHTRRLTLAVKGHVGMQFNLQVTILKIEDGVSFASWHFRISMPTLTPHHHTTQTHLLTGFTTSESTHQAVSAAVTQRPYHVAHRQPGQCLQVYGSLTWLLWQLFIYFFHFSLLDMSVYLSFAFILPFALFGSRC